MRSRDARAFTLIELLVVVGTIAVLVSITLVVAGGVQRSARQRATTDTLRQVEVGIETFITETGGDLPPPIVLAPDPLPSVREVAAYPLADAVDLTDVGDSGPTINSIGLFIAAAEREGLTGLFNGLPEGRLRLFDAHVDDGGRQPELRTIFDAWNRPIRFVHPAFDGIVTEEYLAATRADAASLPGDAVPLIDPARSESNAGDAGEFFAIDATLFPREVRAPDGTVDPNRSPIVEIRRNAVAVDAMDTDGGDSDGGVCVNGRPYAYSAGPDGDPATLGDSNVYATTPRFVVPGP